MGSLWRVFGNRHYTAFADYLYYCGSGRANMHNVRDLYRTANGDDKARF